MKGLAAIALSTLAGCASFDQWQHERTMNQTVVAEVAPGQYRTLTYRELAELDAQKAQEDERRRKTQAEYEQAQRNKQAELENREAASREAARARIVADEARGYKHVTITDLVLDRKTIPLGSKRAVTGYYQLFGEFETLGARPVDSAFDSSVPRVVLLTAKSPRDVRAKLLGYPCRPAFCQVVLLGRTTKCTIEQFGLPARRDVCLAIDEIW